MSGERVYALKFSRWKQHVVRSCFPGREVVFTDAVSAVPAGAQLAVWGMDRRVQQAAAGVKLLRLEDGFLRSVGLGADLIRPLSWVVDSRGIYYDATCPSDLEVLLSQTIFDAVLLERAKRLRERIVSEGITKYNVGASSWSRVHSHGNTILVPGQVETDDSLNYGAPATRTNMAMLQAVRMANPDAYVLYKPHPDVMAGLRAKGRDEEHAAHYCDEVVTDVAMAELLLDVDEVHVLTSLAGFEALLRGKRVTCYGQPFFAGWGLTKDLVPIARRSRRLSLDELVAGALILYPRYFSRAGGASVSPEQALDELADWKAAQGDVVPWWREVLRIGLRRIVGVR